MSQDHSFDFDDTTFERVEVAGGILLASAEVDYGELFTEVIWDGLITAEKRARLDRAAEVFGLDRDRVRRIEQGLAAAYEARHRVRVQEEAPPSGTGVPFEGMAESPDAFEPAATAFRPTQPPPGHRGSVPSAPLLQVPPAAAAPLEPARPAPAEAGDARRSGDHWAAAAQPVGAQPAWPAPRHEGPTPSGGFHVPPARPPEPSWQEQSAAAARGSWQDHPPQGAWQDAPRATQASWPQVPPQQPPPQLGEVSWEEEDEPPPAMRLPIAHDATVQEDAPLWTATQEMPPPEEAEWRRGGAAPMPEARFTDEQPFPSQPPPWMRPASSPPAQPEPAPLINEPPTPSGGFMAPTSIAPLGAEVRAGLEESRPSFSPFAAAVDEPHLYALQRRIAFLESQNQTLRTQNSELSSRLGELEREVDMVRRGSIDVDLAASDEHAAARPSADPASLHRAVVEQPRDAERTRALFRALKRASDADRRWCAAQVLQVLDESPASDERAAFEQHRTHGLIKPAKSLTAELWRSLLLHPDEDPLCGDIFAAIVPAVLLTRAATQRRERNAPVLDPANKVDPTGSTLQAVRCVAWAAAILGMEPPPIYMERDWSGMFETVVAVPPAARVGRLALSGRSPSELAFAAGRHLSWYRHDHIIVKLTGSTRELEDLFLAAFTIGNPGLPIKADVRSRVEPVARAIEPLLEPPSIARLKHHVFAFIEQGGRTHLRRWAMAADRTAARAGLLLANDLAAARTMLELEDPRRAPALYEDLIVFASSERYTELRHRLGIAIA